MANKRKCAVCGKMYEYCPNCKNDKEKALYHSLYCSKDCKDIMVIASDFEAGVLKKDEAQKRLSETKYKTKTFVSNSLKKTIGKLSYPNQNFKKNNKKNNVNNEVVETVEVKDKEPAVSGAVVSEAKEFKSEDNKKYRFSRQNIFGKNDVNNSEG